MKNSVSLKVHYDLTGEVSKNIWILCVSFKVTWKDLLSMLSSSRRASSSLWIILLPRTRCWRLQSDCLRLSTVGMAWPSGAISSSGCLEMTLNQIHLGSEELLSSLCSRIPAGLKATYVNSLYLKHTQRHLHAPEKERVNKQERVKMSKFANGKHMTWPQHKAFYQVWVIWCSMSQLCKPL